MKKSITLLVFLGALHTSMIMAKTYYVGNCSMLYQVQVWPKNEPEEKVTIPAKQGSSAPSKTMTKAAAGNTIRVSVASISATPFEYDLKNAQSSYLMVDAGISLFQNTKYAVRSSKPTVKVLEFTTQQAAQQVFPQYFK